MTTETKVFKLEKDFCRCCHAEGNFISLSEIINNESLCDIIKNCFNISIALVSGNLSTVANTICPNCIRRLKDAYSFKQQVQNCEKYFYELYFKDAFFEAEGPALTNTMVKLKAETLKDGQADNILERMSTDNSEDDINLVKFKDIDKKSKMKYSKGCGTLKKIKKGVDKIEDKKDTKIANFREDIRDAVKLIIKFSNATPFRWSYSKFMCFFCDRTFTKFTELKQHNFDHFDPNPELHSVKAESKVKFEVTDLTCKVCPKAMQTFDDLLDHIILTHNGIKNSDVRSSIFAFKIQASDVSCPQCSESFTFFGTLLSHVYKNHANSGQFLCDACGKGFLTKLTLRKHIKTQHSPTNYVCQKCNTSFKTFGAYSYHRIVHNGVFNCPQCPETFTSWYLRKRHLAFVHDETLQISCEHCPKKFIKYNSLKWHLMSVHRNEKPVSCEMCDFKCINKTVLKRHMVCHSVTKPFQCHVCVKAFQRKEHLESHVRIHTNDRRFVCKECGKGFVQVAGLRVHVKTHHAGKS